MRVQRQEDLSSWKPVGERMRGAYGERGLADSGHPADRVNAHHPTAAMSRGSVRVATAAVLIGSGRGRVAPGGGLEVDALLVAQRERIGEQLQRILLRDRKDRAYANQAEAPGRPVTLADSGTED